ncbi:MAG: acyltransferase family protein [Cyclobacteriaceae bacterium]
MKNNFLSYIHNFRGFAILLIVGVHCRTSLLWPEDSIFLHLLTYGLDSSTILFVFISGFLFQYLNAEKFNYSDYLSKKIKYVIIPYVLISIPALLDKLLIETDAHWMSSFYKGLYPPFQVVYMLATGKHSGPFYFIPMISIIFLISPILYRIQKTNYFSVITAVVVGIGLFTYAYGYYATLLESLIYFLPVYLFGMWASKNREWILGVSNYILLGMVGLYLTIFYLEMSHAVKVEHLHFFESTPHYLTSQFNWGKLKELILAIVLLIFFYRLSLRGKNLNYLAWLGSFSFGIYFVHIYFINVIELTLNYFHISRMQNGIGYFAFTAAIIGISALTVYIIKKVFSEKSRILIGS